MPQVTSQIVLVDDDPQLAHYYRSVLATAGWEPVVCWGGQRGWAWLQSHPQPALLLTDLEMPGLDGFQLLAHVRSDPRLTDLPVIVMTDFVEPADHRRAHRLRAQLLTKGEVSPQELVRRVQKVI